MELDGSHLHAGDQASGIGDIEIVFTHKDFAKRFAEALSLAEPDRFTATMSKARRKGHIFIDWLRNQRGATDILPYSARSRDHATARL